VTSSTKGSIAATAAFFIWGILPIFWKLLSEVPVLQVTAHRVIWTLAVLLPIILIRRSWGPTLQAFKNPKVLAIHIFAGLMLSANWLIYVWATLNGRILEAALGYYINPFFYILIGAIFWGERYTKLQLSAIVIAILGVLLQLPATQGFPWVALILACSFTAYGLIRKMSPLGAFGGLTLETSALLPIALIYLGIQQSQGTAAFGSTPLTTLLLCGTGLATAAPLLCFAHGARNISLSQLGILQFIGPTGQFLIGWAVFQEPLPPMRLLSFTLIWIAVAVYIYSLWKQKPAQL